MLCVTSCIRLSPLSGFARLYIFLTMTMTIKLNIFRNQCFCGNSYGRNGPELNRCCSFKCVGNPSEFCGGDGCESVYYTGYDDRK